MMEHKRYHPPKDRPVIGLVDEYPAGFVDPNHCHESAQFLFASAGAMLVTTERTSFVIPPQRALWLPAGAMHSVLCRSAVSLRTLYVDPLYDSGPRECRVLEVSDFLKALILEVVHFSEEYELEGREGRIAWLLLDEIARMATVPYCLPMPSNPRLKHACQMIAANPADQRDIDAWASFCSMSRRAFTRAFRHDFGMSFALWRQQARLIEALSLLAIGHSVTSVAFDVGYESPSAFTAMFRRAFGEPPSIFLSHATADYPTASLTPSQREAKG